MKMQDAAILLIVAGGGFSNLSVDRRLDVRYVRTLSLIGMVLIIAGLLVAVTTIGVAALVQ